MQAAAARSWSASTTSARFARPSARPARRCASCSGCDVRRSGPFIVVECRANAFLHHMVRNIVGSLVRIGRGEESPGG